MYWNVSSVSISEGLDGDPGLKVYRDLKTTDDNTKPRQTVDVVVLEGMQARNKLEIHVLVCLLLLLSFFHYVIAYKQFKKVFVFMQEDHMLLICGD